MSETDSSLQDRARGCLIGLAVGDALFGPAEFLTPPQIHDQFGGPLTDMVGGGWLKLRSGQVTDDTEMAICLATSLARRRKYDRDDVLRRYLRWQRSGPTDIGGTISGTLTLISQGFTPEEATEQVHVRQHGETAGNGTIMRCAPIAVAFATAPEQRAAAAAADAHLTHHDPAGAEACITYCDLIAARLNNDPAPVTAQSEAVFHATDATPDEAETRCGRAPGYVLTALAVATAAERIAYQHTEQGSTPGEAFEQALIWAGNLGGDSDTIAAVAGALLGARYGETAIPERWITQLEPADELRNLADQLITLT